MKFALLIGVVLAIIIDLGRPCRDLIRVRVRLQERFERHGPWYELLAIPPAALGAVVRDAG